jgi:hypothetical protein
MPFGSCRTDLLHKACFSLVTYPKLLSYHNLCILHANRGSMQHTQIIAYLILLIIEIYGTVRFYDIFLESPTVKCLLSSGENTNMR